MIQSLHEIAIILRAIEFVECRSLLRWIMGNPTESIIVQALIAPKIPIVGYGAPMRINNSVIHRGATPHDNLFNFLFCWPPFSVKKIMLATFILIGNLVPVDKVALRVRHTPRNGVIKSDDDTWRAGNRYTHHVDTRTIKMHGVPD